MRTGTPFWRQWAHLRLRLLPPRRRVLLHITQDGRHLPFLLSSLDALGYGIIVQDSPIIYRELLSMGQSRTPPFLIAGPSTPPAASLFISDVPSPQKAQPPTARKLTLDYRYFDTDRLAPRMPYFMHPRAYHHGWHRLPAPPAEAPRHFRVGFFGTQDPEFYQRHFTFPELTRTAILEAFDARFGAELVQLEGSPSNWPAGHIAVALDRKGGDQPGKQFLDEAGYCAALRACDFILSPPGWCMPISHSLVEAMGAGAIPITNGASYMSPPLMGGQNCLSFSDRTSLIQAIEAALAMPTDEVIAMRARVERHYATHLAPGRWLDAFLADPAHDVCLVNAEEHSVWPDGGRPIAQAATKVLEARE